MANKSRYVAQAVAARDRMNEMVAKLKAKPCHDCGQEYPWYVMQFDHVKGRKMDGIGNLKKFNNESRLLREIKKCEVVCANCHAIRTYTRIHARDRGRTVRR